MELSMGCDMPSEVTTCGKRRSDGFTQGHSHGASAPSSFGLQEL